MNDFLTYLCNPLQKDLAHQLQQKNNFLIYHISRFKVLKLFNQLKAAGSHVWNPNVEYYRFKNLVIETEDPTFINVDGENLGTTPLEVEVMASALKVFH